jgi:O-antigen ligase
MAFSKAPVFGSGAGSFVSAAGLASYDTAHNSALSILVAGGLCAFSIAVAIVVLAARAVAKTQGALRLALATGLVVWAMTSLVATVEASRTTWLLMAAVAVAARLAVDEPDRLAACFPLPRSQFESPAAEAPIPQARWQH